MTFRYDCQVRWGDLDAQAHLNNGAFVDYLQEARVGFLLAGPAEAVALLDTGVVVVGHQVEYRAPVGYSGEALRIELWVESVGASRFVIGYLILDGGQVAVRARTIATPYELATSSLRRLTAPERDYLRSQLDAELADEPERRPLRPLTIPPKDVGEVGHRCPIQVRWSDLDAYGHANNVRFFDYIQEARVVLIRALDPDRGQPWVVVRQDLDYLRPVDFRIEPYEVRTVVTRVGNRSIELAATLGDRAGIPYARARTVLVAERPITSEQRSQLAGWSAGNQAAP